MFNKGSPSQGARNEGSTPTVTSGAPPDRGITVGLLGHLTSLLLAGRKRKSQGVPLARQAGGAGLFARRKRDGMAKIDSGTVLRFSVLPVKFAVAGFHAAKG